MLDFSDVFETPDEEGDEEEFEGELTLSLPTVAGFQLFGQLCDAAPGRASQDASASFFVC